MTGIAHSLPLARSRELLPLTRDAALTAFFVALAFSISVSQILLVLLGVLALPWASVWRARGFPAVGAALRGDVQALGRSPLTRPWLAWVGLTLLSAVTSGDSGWSLWIARDVLRIATFYLVLGSTHDATHATRLWQGFLGVLGLMAVLGLGQAYVCGGRADPLLGSWQGTLCPHPSRVSGPFSIYMTFGGVLSLGALVIVAHLANVPWRRVGWMLPAAVLTVTALAFTYSRNAWLGLLAGTLAIVTTARRAGRILLGVAVLGVTAALLVPASVAERAGSMLDLRDATIRDRVAMWQAGLAMIADHPLLGVGPGQVRAWYIQYRRPDAIRPTTGHLHNSPIHIAAERGLPALAVWLWIWVVFFREAGRVFRRLGRDRPTERALVSASLGGVTGFLVAGLFEHNFGDAEVVMLVYALMALPFIVARDLPPESLPRSV